MTIDDRPGGAPDYPPAQPEGYAPGYPAQSSGYAYGPYGPPPGVSPYGSYAPQGTMPPGSPFGTPPSPSSDGISIAAFVVSLVGIVLVSIPLAIAGLRRTKNGARGGRGFAIAASVISGVWIVLFGVAIVVPLLLAPHRAADGTVTRAGVTAALNLHVGDCTTVSTSLGSTTSPKLIGNTTVVPCAQSHNAQVALTPTSPDAVYPGQQQLLTESRSTCANAVLTYLGTTSTGLGYYVVAPSAQAWDTGDHKVVCLAVDLQKSITGDIRNDH